MKWETGTLCPSIRALCCSIILVRFTYWAVYPVFVPEDPGDSSRTSCTPPVFMTKQPCRRCSVQQPEQSQLWPSTSFVNAVLISQKFLAILLNQTHSAMQRIFTIHLPDGTAILLWNSLMDLHRKWQLLMLFQNVSKEYHTYECIKPVGDTIVRVLSLMAVYTSTIPKNQFWPTSKVFLYSSYSKAATCLTLWLLPVSVRCLKTLEVKMYLSACRIRHHGCSLPQFVQLGLSLFTLSK